MNSLFNFDFYTPQDLDFTNFEELDTTGDVNNNPAHEEYQKELNQDGKKSHLCTFPGCGKIFKFKSEINRHLVIHFADRPYVCPSEGCNKAFKRADALENHVRIHNQDLPFQCDHPGCDLKFVTKSALRYHLLKHENQRVFTCDFEGCGKSFLTKAQLRQHEKAENYHKKVAAIHHATAVHHQVAVLEEPEPIKKVKAMPIASKDPFANLMATPAPKLAKSLAWETKNIDEFEEPTNIQMNPVTPVGGLEDMLKKILEENKMLKEKLDLCTRMMDVFQENKKLKDQLSSKSGADYQFGYEANEPEQMSYPAEGSEFSFLNF